MSAPQREKLFTTAEVAELIQMEGTSVVKWINEGRLVAYRTPGGHRRIRATDFLAFLRQHRMYVPPELSAGRVRVLFVDEDRHVLGAMTRAMKSHADRVEFLTAQSGVEALVRVGAEKPDVLVLDIAMPQVDGFVVLEKLKANPGTRAIDVLMLSEHLTPQLEKKAHELGASAVHEKPISAEDLFGLVTGLRAARPG